MLAHTYRPGRMKINQGVIGQVSREKQQYGDAALIDIHKRFFSCLSVKEKLKSLLKAKLVYAWQKRHRYIWNLDCWYCYKN